MKVVSVSVLLLRSLNPFTFRTTYVKFFCHPSLSNLWTRSYGVAIQIKTLWQNIFSIIYVFGFDDFNFCFVLCISSFVFPFLL